MFKFFNSKNNKPKKLEDKLIKDGFFYIENSIISIDENKISLTFINNPNGVSKRRVLHFSKVKNLSDEILSEDFEDGDIDTLIGLDEYPENCFVKYVLHTVTREIIFCTKEKPQIEDLK